MRTVFPWCGIFRNVPRRQALFHGIYRVCFFNAMRIGV